MKLLAAEERSIDENLSFDRCKQRGINPNDPTPSPLPLKGRGRGRGHKTLNVFIPLVCEYEKK